PLYVEPGGTFTITIDGMGATDFPPFVPGTGTISVTGPVTPSGNFGVGRDVFGNGTPFPNHLTFQATGQPGEGISVNVVGATSFIGTVPNGFFMSCSVDSPQLGTVTIK